MQGSDSGHDDAAEPTRRASRREAAADALGLLRAEGLEPSPEHKALAARWIAREIDTEQFERLNWEQVCERAILVVEINAPSFSTTKMVQHRTAAFLLGPHSTKAPQMPLPLIEALRAFRRASWTLS